MRNKYKYKVSQKNLNNSNQKNINQGKIDSKYEVKVEIKNNNYLNKNDYLPDISQNNNIRIKYSNCSTNKTKLASSVNNNYASIYKNQSNQFINKNNLNRNQEKEKNKINREQTPKIKDDEMNFLKTENIILRKKIETIEGQFFQFKKVTINDINEIKKNNITAENFSKSRFNENSNKFNFLNENIKKLNDKIDKVIRTFEEFEIKNKTKNENNGNILNKIYADIEILKNQFVENNNNKSHLEVLKYSKDNHKEELVELNKEKEIFKLELEKLNVKVNEINNLNIELKKRNEELKNQNIKLIEEKKEQNIELKRKSEKLLEQNKEFQKQKEEIINLNEQIKKLNNKLINQNDEIKNLKEQIKKFGIKNEGSKKSNENEKNDENIKKLYEKKYAIVGLYNTGNSCYMNSVLQLLKNIPQFTYNIFKLNDNKDKFLIHLKSLFINLCDPNNTSFSPKEFKKYLGLEKSGKIFSGNEQYDSNIFYLALLNIIDKKLNTKKIQKIDMTKYEDKTVKERQIIYKKMIILLKQKHLFLIPSIFIL